MGLALRELNQKFKKRIAPDSPKLLAFIAVPVSSSREETNIGVVGPNTNGSSWSSPIEIDDDCDSHQKANPPQMERPVSARGNIVTPQASKPSHAGALVSSTREEIKIGSNQSIVQTAAPCHRLKSTTTTTTTIAIRETVTVRV